MVKKVKTYLNNAEIIEDENRLLEIVNQCEPGEHSFPFRSASFAARSLDEIDGDFSSSFSFS